ncbi:MAG: hypothetical protein IPP48_04535 [Chitinophagaceae bacterium]|nr:hypothetical protein [Chitinophagaceae bacterium]
MHLLNRCLFLIMFGCLCFETVRGQQVAVLDEINKSKNSAKLHKKKIASLQSVLIRQFLIQANSSTSKLNKQIHSFIDTYKKSGRNNEFYKYPQRLKKSNLSLLVKDFDINWGILPSSSDTSNLEGYGNSTLTVIISIPLYDNYHRGEAINSISFLCTLTENVSWAETSNNKLPIEKLPSYKRIIKLNTEYLNFDKFKP